MSKVSSAFIAIALFILAFSPASARIIYVPGDEATIQEAINASLDGDTVLVAPGIYLVNLDFGGRSIHLTSSAGPALTELRPADISLPIITLVTNETSGTTVTGLTIGHAAGRACIRIAGGAPNIIGNHFINNTGGYFLNDAIIYITGMSHAVIKNNLFNSPGTYINIGDNSDTNLVIVNNTIYGGELGLHLRGHSSVVANNIVTGCLRGISVSGVMIRGYNNIWGNTTNWSFGSPDPTDISVDPQFIDAANGNFGLLRSSGCVDAGNPGVSYNDPDGTRNDIGAFPFDQKIPAIYNLNLGSENLAHVINHTPTFEWSYYDTTETTQIGYEITVGELDGSDIWTTGQVMSEANSVLYGGPYLQDGVSYYCRARVYNGDIWGDWKYINFRMNFAPSPPTPAWPLNIAVSNYGLRLLVSNSSADDDGDSLSFDFEIAPSPGGTPVASLYGVPGQPAQTGSGIFKQSWPVGVNYVWQARSFDGFEYSDWSPYQPFVTRAPYVLIVPADYPTIQAGIDFAQERDTVLVAPGTYTGDGNRDLSFHGINLVLKSSDGAAATIIDCQAGYMDNHWGFYLNGYEDSTALIDGFTVKNSYTDELGAIYLTTSSPTIANCIITENDGSGILAVSDNYKWANRQRVHITGCTITNNSAYGIFTFSRAEIRNCQISYNGIDGIYLLWADSADLIQNLVRGNTGNGLYLYTMTGGPWNINNNTFVGNNHGIYFYYEPPKAGDQAASLQWIASLTQNIFAFNRQYGFYGSYGLGSNCNNSYGNLIGDWYPGSPYGPYAGDAGGNITADPLFCDTVAGDFHISAASPCIPAHNSCHILMGAFGVGCDFVCGDVNADGRINLLDVSFIINYIYRGGPAPDPVKIADVDHNDTVNLLDVSYLINYLYRHGPALACP